MRSFGAVSDVRGCGMQDAACSASSSAHEREKKGSSYLICGLLS